MEYLKIDPKQRDDWDRYFEKTYGKSITSVLQEPENILKQAQRISII